MITYLNNFFLKISLIQVELNLTVKDVMSTCIFLFYNKNNKQGIIYAFGDGVIQIDDNLIVLDHENEPKYFSMFWKDLTGGKSTLTGFLSTYEQIWKFNNFNNVVISTDGILSFKNTEAIQYFFNETLINGSSKIHQESFFEKIYNISIQKKWTHNDDLGIIRIINHE